mgnify:CR=1 FL=1
MRALVTGSTGFLGQHLVRELLAHGYAVTALVRTFERTRALPRGVRAFPADITQPEALRGCLAGVDVVFHLAAVPLVGVKAPDRARVLRINVDGTRNVLAQAAAAGVGRIVHVSSLAVYGHTAGRLVDETYRPGSVAFQGEAQRTQHLAHFQAAAPLQASGAPVIIACLGALYGPGDRSGLARLLRRHARRQLPVLIGPDNARSWTLAADAAAGLRLAAERGRLGEVYHLAGPAHTWRAFLEACAQASGAPPPWLWLPSRLAAVGAQLLARPAPHWAERLRSVAGITYLGRADKAAQELGWHARLLAEGLPSTFDWLKET